MNKNLTTKDSEQQQAPHLRVGAVSSRYLSAEKAKQMTIEALKEIAAKEYDTKCVIEQIVLATQNGSYHLVTYNDDRVRENLVLLGYKCSEPYQLRMDIYMRVSWS
jgi:2-methylcitrate dehydratase PrpD